jgi:hypothetical protein
MSNMSNVANAQMLKADLEAVEHPEYGMTEIEGVRLSRSDCDTVYMYCDAIIRNRGEFPRDLMSLTGGIEKLFKKYDLPTTNKSTCWI